MDKYQFTPVKKVNGQNARWICQDACDVPRVMHTNVCASVTVLALVSSERDFVATQFFDSRLRVNANSHAKVLETVAMARINELTAGTEYVFQQDTAPAHKAGKTQACLYDEVPNHWSQDFSPTLSPDEKSLN